MMYTPARALRATKPLWGVEVTLLFRESPQKLGRYLFFCDMP